MRRANGTSLCFDQGTSLCFESSPALNADFVTVVPYRDLGSARSVVGCKRHRSPNRLAKYSAVAMQVCANILRWPGLARHASALQTLKLEEGSALALFGKSASGGALQHQSASPSSSLPSCSGSFSLRGYYSGHGGNGGGMGNNSPSLNYLQQRGEFCGISPSCPSSPCLPGAA